ncbi:WD40/YVTN/BNR-like repeat-containing protein [Nocardia heshunensis]
MGNVWHPASFWGVLATGTELNDPDISFAAGQLNSVVRLDEEPVPVILAAAQYSGVWLVELDGGDAIPLSTTWDRPGLNVIRRGVHGSRHVFAAGDALWETDTTDSMPLFAWREIPIVDATGTPLNTGVIYDLVIVPEPNTIVLACQTGVYWAEIPIAGSAYTFDTALNLTVGPFSGIALGPQRTVVAAAWGTPQDVPPRGGLFVGEWQSLTGPLVFSEAKYLGNTDNQMFMRTSIASCPTDRVMMYAVAGEYHGTRDSIYQVLRSGDGGRSWAATGNNVLHHSPLFGYPTTNTPGDQQARNNCIAVGASHDVVVVGWHNGYFVSENGGEAWTMIPGTTPHLHTGVHAVEFDDLDPNERTLFICSDGGMAVTTDLGATHSSLTNRKLPNLEARCVDRNHQTTERGFLTARGGTAGVMAMSLQDNGDAYISLYPADQPWRPLDEGDGEQVALLHDGNLLYRDFSTVDQNNVEFGNRVREAWFDRPSGTFTNLSIFPTQPLSDGVVPLDGVADGLGSPDVLAAVTAPSWANSSAELLVAVAVKDQTLYGMFAGAPNPYWKRLATLGLWRHGVGPGAEFATAIGSGDGDGIIVGTSTGRLLQLMPDSWHVHDTTPKPLPGTIARLVVHTRYYAFAIAAGQQLWVFRESTWTQLPGPPTAPGDFVGLATDTTGYPEAVFVATATQVFVTRDSGLNWDDISAGLPAAPRIRDLVFVRDPSGAHFLCAATEGWSVWRRQLNGTDGYRHTVRVQGHTDMVDRGVFSDTTADPHFGNTVKLGADDPWAFFSFTQDDLDEVCVIINFNIQWYTDDSIDLIYDIVLYPKDELDESEQDHKSGTVHIAAGASRNIIEDLVIDESWPDRAHVDMTVFN